MPESGLATSAVAATVAEVVLLTIQGSGVSGPANIDEPTIANAIPNQIIRGMYAFTWGSTTTSLTLRCRKQTITGGGSSGVATIVKAGPGAANSDIIAFEFLDQNAAPGQQYVITGQAGTAAVTAAQAVASVNDFS